MRASRHAEWRCGRSRWLAPTLSFFLMQQQSAKMIPQNRPLTDDEGALLQWLLDHSTATTAEKAQLPFVSVVGRCPCGCPSIHLAVSGKVARPGSSSAIIADICGTTPEGVFVGVMLHIRDGLLSELEAYPLGQTETFSFPRPEALEPMGRSDEKA